MQVSLEPFRFVLGIIPVLVVSSHKGSDRADQDWTCISDILDKSSGCVELFDGSDSVLVDTGTVFYFNVVLCATFNFDILFICKSRYITIDFKVKNGWKYSFVQRKKSGDLCRKHQLYY